MPTAARLEVRGKDKSTLRSWVRASGIRAGLAQRARIVLLAGEGHSNTEIAARVGVSRPTVIHWRARYVEGGVAALEDRKRSGRRRHVDEAEVVVATLTGPPQRLGVTHWSSRLLAAELGLSFATVARIWRDWDLQPWRVETFKFSTDPELEAKVRDVVGRQPEPVRDPTQKRNEAASGAREVRLVDDLDGKAADETVQFGIDGRRYEIDLSSGNARRLRDSLASFVAAARRAGGPQRRARHAEPTGRWPAAAAVQPVSADPEQGRAIREWARQKGMKVSDRGRISKAVLDAFHKEH
jgi:transposase